MPPVQGITNAPPPAGTTAPAGHGEHGRGGVTTQTPVFSVSGLPAQTAAAPTSGHVHASSAATAGSWAPQSGSIGGHSGHGGALAGQQHSGGHGFQEQVLGLRAYRQQLLASNIANADTPNYKAVDIDFQEALRIAQAAANREPVALKTTAPGHIAAQAPQPLPPFPLKYRVPGQASADGNTVELDVERAKFAENALMYEFALDRVSMHYKHMEELFKNLT